MENRLTVFADIAIFDSAKLDIRPEMSREGYLRCGVRATRAGIFTSRLLDGRIARALRPRAEVFKQSSMDTAKGIPCTRTHPHELLTANTAKIFVVGATGDTALPDGDFLLLEANIFDGPTIESIKKGNREVSLGYQAKVTAIPGIDPEFGPYDVIFSDLDYNHLAVDIPTGDARAGTDAVMIMDSKDLTLPKTEEKKPMKKIKLADGDHEVEDSLHDAIKNHLDGLDKQHAANQKQLADQLSEVKAKQGKVEDADEDLSGMAEATEGEEEDSKKEAKMDSFEPKTEAGKKLKTFVTMTFKGLIGAKKETVKLMDSAGPDKIAAMATERAKIVGTICAMDSKSVPADLFKEENLALMKKAILLRTPKATFEGMDSARIQGQFDMVAAGVASKVGLALGTALSEGAEERAIADAKTTGPKRWEARPLKSSSRAAAKV